MNCSRLNPSSRWSRPSLRRRLLSTLTAMSMAASAQASIATYGAGELLLVVWDPVSEASYSLDLGLDLDSFFSQAQVDAGYQQFLPRLTGAADPRWQKFLNRVAPAAQQANLGAVPFVATSDFGFVVSSLKDRLRWAVIGVDLEGFDPVDFRVFHTLEQGPGNGVLNPRYNSLTLLKNDNLVQTINPLGEQLIGALNTDAANPDSSHSPGGVTDNYALNGSSLTPKGTAGYFDAPGTEFYRMGSAAGISITNPVGKSSWFYFTTSSSNDGLEKVVIDEFDNLTADGYWGLDQDPADGAFVLSFTLEGSATAAALRLREFAAGIGRTEIGGGFVVRKLEGAAAIGLESGAGFNSRKLGAVVDAGLNGQLAITTAVPEPQSLLLWLAGLAGLVAWARRRHGG